MHCYALQDGEKKGIAKGLRTVVGERFGPEAVEGFTFSLLLLYLQKKKKCITGNILGKRQDELVALLEAEEDFQSGQTLLEELLTKLGARSLLLPKFHCEFNPIECAYR